MKVIIDENYTGVVKSDGVYVLDKNLLLPNDHVVITIPLVCKSIRAMSLKSSHYLKVKNKVTIKKSIEIKGNASFKNEVHTRDLIIDGNCHVNKNLNSRGKVEVTGNLFVAEALYIGVVHGPRLPLIVGGTLHVFGVRTHRYALLLIETYFIIMTDEIVKIGCTAHSATTWKNFDESKCETYDDHDRYGPYHWMKRWKPALEAFYDNMPAIY